MKKLLKLLHRFRHEPRSIRPVKRFSRHLEAEIKRISHVSIKVHDTATFFKAYLLMVSLTNKEAFETAFERQRKDLSDLWETLSRQEKNLLANTRLDEIKRRLTSIETPNGEIIWIACFDELLNALYDKRISIFELDQYFKLYTEFKSRLIPVEHYALLPFAQRFIDIDVLDVSQDSVLFAYAPLKSVFRVTMRETNAYHFDLLPLKDGVDVNQYDSSYWCALHRAWCDDYASTLIDLITTHQLVDIRLEKKLIHLRKKLS
jgi:hypothetical protein